MYNMCNTVYCTYDPRLQQATRGVGVVSADSNIPKPPPDIDTYIYHLEEVVWSRVIDVREAGFLWLRWCYDTHHDVIEMVISKESPFELTACDGAWHHTLDSKETTHIWELPSQPTLVFSVTGWRAHKEYLIVRVPKRK